MEQTQYYSDCHMHMKFKRRPMTIYGAYVHYGFRVIFICIYHFCVKFISIVQFPVTVIRNYCVHCTGILLMSKVQYIA